MCIHVIKVNGSKWAGKRDLKRRRIEILTNSREGLVTQKCIAARKLEQIGFAIETVVRKEIAGPGNCDRFREDTREKSRIVKHEEDFDDFNRMRKRKSNNRDLVGFRGTKIERDLLSFKAGK
jgi:hypothetical protein